jgi:hypothetical protein
VATATERIFVSKTLLLSALLALGGVSVAQTPASPGATQPAPQTTTVRIIETGKDGAPVSTEIRPGALKLVGSAGMGKAVAVSFLTMGFGGSPDIKYEAFGEFADKVVGGNIQEIRIDNFDPKAAGAAGDLALLRFGVEDGTRFLRLGGQMGNEPHKMHTKKMPKSRMVRDANGWLISVGGPLEPGHYVVMSPRSPAVYWDFDVK